MVNVGYDGDEQDQVVDEAMQVCEVVALPRKALVVRVLWGKIAVESACDNHSLADYIEMARAAYLKP